MNLNKYYRDELEFLRSQGKEFAEANPNLSQYLAQANNDPDVERLLEGFSFLTGRLRQKIEDQLPELTHSTINMLWPNYLRPVPSATIVQYSPNIGAITTKQVISKHSQLKSIEVGYDDLKSVSSDSALNTLSCTYTTTHDVALYPVRKRKVVATHSREESIIDLVLDVEDSNPLHHLQMDTFRLFLGADNYTANTMCLWLNHYLTSMQLVIRGTTFDIPLSAFQQSGFNPQESLLPYPDNVYQGYRILQEYLCFPEGFLSFELTGLDKILPPATVAEMSIRFVFNRRFPADIKIRDNAFELYCVPAVNLFKHEADPINLTGQKVEYKISPSGSFVENYEVFNVESVSGWLSDDEGRLRGGNRRYSAFESFHHEIERSEGRSSLYYRSRVKDSIKGIGFDHFLSFVRGDEQECIDLTETVSLSLKCTNRLLPDLLQVGDICMTTEDSASFCRFKNITKPTQSLRPTLDGSLLWTLISNMSLNYLSLLSKDALVAILRAYDFKALVNIQAQRSASQRLEGIVDIETTPVDRLVKGLPVRGLRSVLTLKQAAFSCEGELYLFGCVLSRFFGLYASINSFHELEVVNVDNSERYCWGMLAGEQPLI
ncbi:type VI secretion system baseplate subunit TssF [Gammaproteobacteria bacterium AS21]